MCGIGGRTIEEAQNNISYEEFCGWVEYRSMRGSFNFAMRNEHDLAMIIQLFANRYRKEGTMPFTVYDFAPHLDRPEPTLDDWRKAV